MPVDLHAYKDLSQYCNAHGVQLVAVSKTKPNEDILALYENGHRVFGENYVQELVKKQEELPKDIHWHFIGHLQSNKVKYIAPFVSLIHGVDSIKLLQAIEKEAGKNNRIIPCLLQMHVAREETKFGFDIDELRSAAAEIFLEKKYTSYFGAGVFILFISILSIDAFQLGLPPTYVGYYPMIIEAVALATSFFIVQRIRLAKK